MRFLVGVGLLCQLACSATLTSTAHAQDLRGHIVSEQIWILEDNTKRAPRDGSFEFWYETPADIESTRVQLDSGEFHCNVSAEAEFIFIGRLRIEDRNALCTWQGTLEDASKPLTLEARFIPASRVHLRDRDSGAELEQQRRVFSNNETSHFTEAPLPHVVPAWNEGIPWPEWHAMRKLEIHASGFVPGSIEIDLLKEGEYWIDLAPEARIVAKVILPNGAPGEELDISGPGNCRLSYPLMYDGQKLTIDELLPGRYVLSRDTRGAGARAPINLLMIDLAAHETRELTFDLTPDTSQKRVRVSGTLDYDVSWRGDFEPPLLKFLYFDPVTQEYSHERDVDVQYTERGLAWDAGLLRTGKHFVVVGSEFWPMGIGWGEEFGVAEGAEPIAVSVPPLVRCRVRLIDAETHAELEASTISYRWGPEERSSEFKYNSVERAPEAKFFAVDSPPGRITVRARVDGYNIQVAHEQVLTDPPEFKIALEPDCRIRVRLREGERDVPLPATVALCASRIDGSGKDQFQSWREGVVILSVDQPGKYKISIPTVDGYQPAAPITVEARRREIVDVVFQLVR